MTAPRPNVLLLGGRPPQLSQEERIRYVADVSTKVKVLNGNRYDHFEPTGETVVEEEHELLVYEWSGCTYVAE
ncbi:DUF5988 family protein [Streptomyces sp. NPDC048191]|uniref:DUF5988 family protein n=1 Tax=Streptomyces sp. NPDC048191 TaxID=3155484 RepID=UPI0033C73EBF